MSIVKPIVEVGNYTHLHKALCQNNDASCSGHCSWIWLHP